MLKVGDLPRECLLEILGFLTKKDLSLINCVNHFFHELSSNDVLWEKFLPKYFCSFLTEEDSKKPVKSQVKLYTSQQSLLRNQKYDFGKHRHCEYDSKMERINIKIVVVGDYGVGKTSLIFRFCQGKLPHEDPTYYDNSFEESRMIGSHAIYCSTVDTSGREDYTRILCYHKTSLFFLCFSLVNVKSFMNMKTFWLPELKRYCPDTPICIVGCKSDLLKQFNNETTKENIVSEERIVEFVKEEVLFGYVITSALTGQGIESLFSETFSSLVKNFEETTKVLSPNKI